MSDLQCLNNTQGEIGKYEEFPYIYNKNSLFTFVYSIENTFYFISLTDTALHSTVFIIDLPYYGIIKGRVSYL